MKPGQLVEFYRSNRHDIVPSGLEDVSPGTVLVEAGSIGMVIVVPTTKYHHARILIDEQIVFVRTDAIRIYVENGFLEMLIRAGVSDGEKE